jgi:hypothetical protein
MTTTRSFLLARLTNIAATVIIVAAIGAACVECYGVVRQAITSYCVNAQMVGFTMGTNPWAFALQPGFDPTLAVKSPEVAPSVPRDKGATAAAEPTYGWGPLHRRFP